MPAARAAGRRLRFVPRRRGGHDDGVVTCAVTPVEYGVAVESYLDDLRLDAASRRVYRIALDTWAWALVGEAPPPGPQRRGLRPPAVALSALDDPATAPRLRAALAARAAQRTPRTLNRELSILRGAIAWWQARGWVTADPARELHVPVPGGTAPRLDPGQIAALFALPVPLPDKALWRLIYDSGAPVGRLLALDITDLDHDRRRAYASGIRWGPRTAHLLRLLTLGRLDGPLFVSERRAPAEPAADRCRLTGRGRLSHRRAAERFTTATRPLDPTGHGWTLRDLRRARRR